MYSQERHTFETAMLMKFAYVPCVCGFTLGTSISPHSAKTGMLGQLVALCVCVFPVTDW